MTEYVISYRVYGPSDITSHGSVGEASVHPRPGESEVNATLDFLVKADDKEEASESQHGLQEKASHAVNILSFVVGDGLVLGKPYPPTKIDSDFRTHVDYTTVIDDFILDIGDRMFESVSAKLSTDNMTERSFTWYNLGMSTETPEDSFVAFWTGLEASVKPEKDLSEEEQKLYKQAKEAVENTLDGYTSLLDRVRTNLGHIQEESTIDALTRVLKSEAEISDKRINKLSELRDARADIVHRGLELDNPDEKARAAKYLLRDLLKSRLPEMYTSLIDSYDGEDNAPYHKVINAEEWLETVFEGDQGLLLSEREIRIRAFALIRDIQEVLRIPLDSHSGWNRPLHTSGEGYTYSPPPDWLSPEIDAMCQYLANAGAVSTEVIRRNIENYRDDIDAESADIVQHCRTLQHMGIVDEDEGFYELNLDGQMCVDGRLDPANLDTGEE